MNTQHASKVSQSAEPDAVKPSAAQGSQEQGETLPDGTSFAIREGDENGQTVYYCVSSLDERFHSLISDMKSCIAQDGAEAETTKHLKDALKPMGQLAVQFFHERKYMSQAVDWPSLAAETSRTSDTWCAPLVGAQQDMVPQFICAKSSIQGSLSTDKLKLNLESPEYYVTATWNQTVQETHEWFLRESKAAEALNESFVKEVGYETAMPASCIFNQDDPDCTSNIAATLRTYICSRRAEQATGDQQEMLKLRVALQSLYELPEEEVFDKISETTKLTDKATLAHTRKRWREILGLAGTVTDAMAKALDIDSAFIKDPNRTRSWLSLADQSKTWTEFAEGAKRLLENVDLKSAPKIAELESLPTDGRFAVDKTWSGSTPTMDEGSTRGLAGKKVPGKNAAINRRKRFKRKLKGNPKVSGATSDANPDEQQTETLRGIGEREALDGSAEVLDSAPRLNENEEIKAPPGANLAERNIALRLIASRGLDDGAALNEEAPTVEGLSEEVAGSASPAMQLASEPAQRDLEPVRESTVAKTDAADGSQTVSTRQGGTHSGRPRFTWAQIAARPGGVGRINPKRWGHK